MNKATRIKAFVDLERINGSTIVKNSTSLFQNLLQNVKREYKKFHEMKDPKMTIISSKPNIELLSDTGSFLDKEDFIKSFIEVKRSYELPFAITQEIQCSKNFEPSSVVFSSQKLFRTLYFVSSAFSREVFYQTQRQHKIWWMKFGSSPGKYSISDQKSESFAKVRII